MEIVKNGKKPDIIRWQLPTPPGVLEWVWVKSDGGVFMAKINLIAMGNDAAKAALMDAYNLMGGIQIMKG